MKLQERVSTNVSLIGVLAGIITLLLRLFQHLMNVRADALPPGFNLPDSWLGSHQLIAGVLITFNKAVFFGLFFFFLIFVMRLLMRRQWLTAVLYILLFALPSAVSSDPMIAVPFSIIYSAITVILLLRFGLLASITASFVLSLFQIVPITTDISAWYGGYTIAIFVAVLALAVWAFHTSLGGQKLFEGGLLDE